MKRQSVFRHRELILVGVQRLTWHCFDSHSTGSEQHAVLIRALQLPHSQIQYFLPTMPKAYCAMLSVRTLGT